jgi:hypothetical protein|tara:strand:- start:610 stop:795 length:186 start_codon:yes stop_codon:yes gene_type:complete
MDNEAVVLLRKEMFKKINEILTQVKLTNGRVNRLEKVLLFGGGIAVGLGVVKLSSLLALLL